MAVPTRRMIFITSKREDSTGHQYGIKEGEQVGCPHKGVTTSCEVQSPNVPKAVPG